MTSAQQQLKKREISPTEAIAQLVNSQQFVNLKLLDGELSAQFHRQMRDRSTALPIIPLLL